MSFNPNKTIDTDVCKAVEKLYDSLKRKGIVLKGLEISKELKLFGTPTKDITLSFGVGYNKRHVNISSSSSAKDVRASEQVRPNTKPKSELGQDGEHR